MRSAQVRLLSLEPMALVPLSAARVAILRRVLDPLYEHFPYDARRQADPVQYVHRYERVADRELVALLAASLAYGRAAQFLPKLAQLFAWMDERGGPAAVVARMEQHRADPFFQRWRHRVTGGETLLQLLLSLQRLLDEVGGLEPALAVYVREGAGTVGVLLSCFVRRLYALSPEPPSRALKHLLPDPASGSACKRLNLFLRWMVRHQPGLEPGGWTLLPPSWLVLPLDTHTLRMSYNLGLTQRTDQSWRTALEVTARLRQLDPLDPVKYDFALCHLGMAGDCPARRQDAICHRCALKGSCCWWE